MSVCLSMIVRDEAHCIRTALDSVAPFIDAWCVVDTGSVDGTQGIVREHMAALGIPGELHEREWVNFGHNRTEALTLAQGMADYIWVMDADDHVEGTPDFTGLSADVYQMRMRSGATEYWYAMLFRDGIDITYRGVTHEYPDWTGQPAERLDGDYRIIDGHISSRNQSGRKFREDVELLLPEVERDPKDARSRFYLAQSYFCLGDYEKAAEHYAERAKLGGFAEEVYFSLYRVAESLARMGDWSAALDAYLRAYQYRPTRVEALHAVAKHYRTMQDYQLGYMFARQAAQIPFPDDLLFVDAELHEWRCRDELAVCAYWVGEYAESLRLCDEILALPLPDEDRERVEKNRRFAAERAGM